MDDLLANLQSPGWWLGVFLVGVVINLVSAYAKPALDAVAGRIWKGFRERSTQTAADDKAELRALRKDPEVRGHYRHQELTLRLKSLFWVIWALFASLAPVIDKLLPELSGEQMLGVAVPDTVTMALSTLLGLVAVHLFIKADVISRKLHRATYDEI